MTADVHQSVSPFSSPEADHLPGHGHHHHRTHGVVPGLVVIAAGGFLLLRELGLLPLHLHVLGFWPLVLVAVGLWMALRRNALTGLALAVLGAGLLAQRLGHPILGAAQLWPVLLIAVGAGLVWKASRRNS